MREHADLIARLADDAEAERLARNTGRLTIEKPDPQHAARRIIIHPLLAFQPEQAGDDRTRPVLGHRIVDIEVPKRDTILQRKLELGRILSEAIDVFKAREELSSIASVTTPVPGWRTLDQGGFRVAQFDEAFDLERRKNYFRNTDPSQISEGIAYQIIRELILADPSIRSSLEILLAITPILIGFSQGD